VLLVGPQEPARHCWPERLRAKPAFHSFRSTVLSSFRCLWAWEQRGCATSSKPPAKPRLHRLH
jgi:hypothetical protein